MPHPTFSGFSEKEADQIFQQAKRFWEDATDAMEPFFDLVEDCERLWRAQLPEDLAAQYSKQKDMASLAPIDAYVNIKSLRAQLRNLFFSNKPYANLSFDGKPNVRDDRLLKAQMVLQGMLDEQSEGRGFEYEGDRACHQALYAGMSCLYTRWVQRYERQPQRDQETQAITIDKKSKAPVFKQVPIAEYAETKAIDIRRVRIDPAAENKDDIRIVGIQSIKNLSELLIAKNTSDGFYNFDEKEIIKTVFDRDNYYRYARGETTRYADKGKENQGFGDKLVEEWCIRGLFRFEGDDGILKFQDLVVCIANREKLVGIKHNDLPINGWELFDFPVIDHELSRLYPMGAIEPVMDAILEKFIKRNQSIDEANRRTYDIYVGDKSACQDLPDQIEFSRGLILKVDTQSAALQSVDAALRPLAKPYTGQDTFTQAMSLEVEIQNGMGRNAYRGSTNPKGVESATGVNELVSGADSLIEQIAKNIADSGFIPAWKKQLVLYNFFKGAETNTIYDMQGKGINISPGELNFFYRIDVEIATSMDKPVMVRRWVEQYPLMANDPFFDQYELRRTNLEILGLPNPDKLLPPNEHLAMIIERENIALAYGLQLPVSPFDAHQGHIEGHVALLKELQQRRQPTEAVEKHIMGHQEILEAQAKGLANTRESGAASGQILNTENAASRNFPGVGQRIGVS